MLNDMNPAVAKKGRDIEGKRQANGGRQNLIIHKNRTEQGDTKVDCRKPEL